LIETIVEADSGRSELVPANDCGRRELTERAFRTGSIRTAFSIHISCVYELNLSFLQFQACRKTMNTTYPWPILIAFVYGARKDMPEPPDEPPDLDPPLARVLDS